MTQATVAPSLGITSTFRIFRDLVDSPRQLFEEHGPIVRLRTPLRSDSVYFINEPEWVEQVLVKRRDRYIKDRVFQWMRPLFKDSILVSEGEKWRRNRRLMAPAFQRRNLAKYADDMVKCTEAAIERTPLGKTVDLHRWSMELTLDIALQTLFSAELEDRGPVIADALDDVLEYADAVMKVLGPIPMWMPIRPVRSLKRGRAAIERVVEDVVSERRASGEEREDVLGLLLAARDDDGSALSDEEIQEEVITLLLAGHETTALLVSYTIMLLCRFPYALAPVQEELDRVLGERPPTAADLPELVEVERLVKESLRLYPPASVIGREAVEDDEIGGEPITPGDQVTISIWALHHDERFYDAPFTFDPSRWTREMERALPRFAFMPFGGGHRTCIGDGFAMMEARLILARLLQRLDFAGEDLSEPDLELSITLRPTGELPVRMTAR